MLSKYEQDDATALPTFCLKLFQKHLKKVCEEEVPDILFPVLWKNKCATEKTQIKLWSLEMLITVNLCSSAISYLNYFWRDVLVYRKIVCNHPKTTLFPVSKWKSQNQNQAPPNL